MRVHSSRSISFLLADCSRQLTVNDCRRFETLTTGSGRNLHTDRNTRLYPKCLPPKDVIPSWKQPFKLTVALASHNGSAHRLATVGV